MAQVGFRWPLLLVATAALCPCETLILNIVDSHDRPVYTYVEVRDEQGHEFQPADCIRETMTKARGGLPFYLKSFVAEGKTVLQVPPGIYTVVADRGPEFRRLQMPVRIAQQGSAEVRISVERWASMRKRGWASADMHIHRPLADMPALMESSGLDLGFDMTRNTRTAPALSPAKPASQSLILSNSGEYERGVGAWMIDGMREPIDLGEGGWWNPPVTGFIARARAQKRDDSPFPWIDSDMPIWWGVPVAMALATPDSLDILHNQFMRYGVDGGAYWGKPYDRVAYSGPAGFARYSMDLYYRYLNLGFRIAASAGTGSGVMPNPVGFNRVYVHGGKDCSPESWARDLKAGHSFVTNGPMLFIHAKRGGSKLKIDRLELVANGKIVQSVSAKPRARRAKARFQLDASAYSWALVRCFLKSDETIRLAQSSPIYLPGRWDASGDARYFVQWISDFETFLKSAKNITAPALQANLALCEEARQVYLSKAKS